MANTVVEKSGLKITTKEIKGGQTKEIRHIESGKHIASLTTWVRDMGGVSKHIMNFEVIELTELTDEQKELIWDMVAHEKAFDFPQFR